MTRKTLAICNGAPTPRKRNDDVNLLKLEYRLGLKERNVNIGLANFVTEVFHLSDRILDLLEIAAYVFAADRKVSRGEKDEVEFNAWARTIEFHIRVRDIKFWQRADVGRLMADMLIFMTGDKEYRFNYYPGHKTEATSLFDSEKFQLEPGESPSVVLFSGGLDSLAGAYERLKNNEEVYLVSHKSGQPSTSNTQNKLAQALRKEFPGKVFHYSFSCGLSTAHASDENQRTRAFLFASIAFALSHALSQRRVFIYENGITSINLWRRQDCINARTSRTTHPKTISLISEFLSKVEDAEFQLINPFNFMTKTDVFLKTAELGGQHLINSSVSCSRTYQKIDVGKHCGTCFQCVDRLLAAYSSGLEAYDYDAGIYAKDIICDPLPTGEDRTTLIDYLRQAADFNEMKNVDYFSCRWAYELADILECAGNQNIEIMRNQVWEMCRRHGHQISDAISKIRANYDKPFLPIPKGSLLEIVADRSYLRSEARRLAESMEKRFRAAIPIAFQTRKPKKEKELNDQIEAILNADNNEYQREFPNTIFALSKIVPDHNVKYGLVIETKYIRKSTSPSVASEGIASDITKISEESFILFVIYDPFRGIHDDKKFISDIEKKRQCLVSIIR